MFHGTDLATYLQDKVDIPLEKDEDLEKSDTFVYARDNEESGFCPVGRG